MLLVCTLKLSRISLNKSSSSPDPKKLLSRPSSAHGPWGSSGLRGGVLGEKGQPKLRETPGLVGLPQSLGSLWTQPGLPLLPLVPFESYLSPRGSESPSCSLSLLLGRRGLFCKGQMWGGLDPHKNQGLGLFGGG